MKWIERLGLDYTVLEDRMRFEIMVPMGAEFIGAQHDATILVMLVRDRYGARSSSRKYKNTEKRTVIRVKDGVMIVEDESRYIGSSNGWHLFEVKDNK